MMGVHDGHRERLKEQFREHGLDSFNEVTALELLLFYAIARKDTNVLSHKLLDKFGSLSNVFEASVQELQEVDGIGESTAILISLIPEIIKKSHVSKANKNKQINNSGDAGEYIMPHFMNYNDEVLFLLCLNGKREVICCKEMARGVVNGVETNIRLIVETALKAKAVSAIIAHNHPSGVAYPSREDEIFTQRIYRSLDMVGIRLEDHLIIVSDGFLSFADMGLMQMHKD